MNRRVVIIGDPGSVFVERLARFLSGWHYEVTVVTQKWENSTELIVGVPILASQAYQSPYLAIGHKIVAQVLKYVNHVFVVLEGERYREAMGEQPDYRPAIHNTVRAALSIPRVVKSIDPRFVIGLEAFSYGLATACCHPYPRILMPWGGDIFRYAEVSGLAFAVVRAALRRATLLVPTATAARDHLVSRYGIPSERIKPVSWGVFDKELFGRSSEERVRAIYEKYGIASGSTVIMNVRRFRPYWGSEVVLKAFLAIAESHPNTHFVIVGGSDNAIPYTDAAAREVSDHDLSHRFTIMKGAVSHETIAELMSVSEIFVSLVQKADMRSSSILEAIASGSVPVLTDLPEYQVMYDIGMRALFVRPGDVAGVVTQVENYLTNTNLRMETAAANLKYLLENEDFETQMRRLLEVIEEAAAGTTTSGRRICEAFRSRKWG